MQRTRSTTHRLVSIAGAGLLSLSCTACFHPSPTADNQSSSGESPQMPSVSEQVSSPPSGADSPPADSPSSGMVFETDDNAAFYEALEKEHQETLTMLPPLPEGAQYPPLSELDALSMTPAPAPDRLFEEGYAKSMTASYWQCAWLSEAVRAAEIGDTEKRDMAVDFLRGFGQSPLAEYFPNWDTYLANIIDPIANNDLSPANTMLRQCPPSTVVPKG